MRLLLGLALTGAALWGCGHPLDPAAPAGTRSLVVTPAWPQRRAQALVTPYVKSDVTRLVVRLATRENAIETPVAERELTAAEIDGSVTFDRLRADTAYRVRGFAFAADGSAISDDGASFVDLALTRDDAPAPIMLPVKLRDTPFDGRASSPPIAITDGQLIPTP